MGSDKHIHFGYFIRWQRGGRKLKEFAAAAGLESEKTVINAEKKPTPTGINTSTLHGIAKALGLTWDELDAIWRKMPAPVPILRGSGGSTKTRVMRVSLDTYARLEWLARNDKMPSPEAYVARHAYVNTREVRIGSANPTLAPAPSHSRAASRARAPQ